jgi:hypothetical protein
MAASSATGGWLSLLISPSQQLKVALEELVYDLPIC